MTGRERAKRCLDYGNPDKYHLGYLPGFPFAITRYARKMETSLEDMLPIPGAAMLAAGQFDSVEQASQAWYHSARSFKPGESRFSIRRAARERYRGVYNRRYDGKEP